MTGLAVDAGHRSRPGNPDRTGLRNARHPGACNRDGTSGPPPALRPTVTQDIDDDGWFHPLIPLADGEQAIATPEIADTGVWQSGNRNHRSWSGVAPDVHGG